MREVRIDEIKEALVPVEGQQPKTVYRVLLGFYIDGVDLATGLTVPVVEKARVYEVNDLEVVTLQAAVQRFADELSSQPKKLAIPAGVKNVQLPDA